MALRLSAYINYVKNEPKMQKKSELSVESDFVCRFVYDKEEKHIEARVRSSYKDCTYSVTVDLDDSDEVVHSHCDCAMGLVACHHVAAALLYGYKHVSKTDVKQSWLARPKSAPPKNTKSMTELHPPRPFKALGRDVEERDVTEFSSELTKLGRFTGMQWLLSQEPEDDEGICFPLVRQCAFTAEMQHTLQMDKDRILQTAEATSGQRKNPLWGMAREGRITASNFGLVLGAIKRKRYPVSLFKTLNGAYRKSTQGARGWGIDHEETAIEMYKLLGGNVEETGIWIHPSGCLGASPDGIITNGVAAEYVASHVHCSTETEPGVLEVKCPFSIKDTEDLITDVVNMKDAYIVKDEMGRLVLDPRHPYYHQVQAAIYFTGCQAADFLVWTPSAFLIIRIGKDKDWEANIDRLKTFFFSEYIASFKTHILASQ